MDPSSLRSDTPALPEPPTVVAARRLAHPALLGAAAAAIAWSLDAGANLALASLAILVGSLATLFALEHLIPFRERWRPSRREWRRDGIYFGINGAVGAGIGAGVGLAAIGLAHGTTGLPLAAEVPLGYLLAALIGYWTHRLGHAVPFLWQMHGVHHAPDKVNSWNNNVIHFADLIFQNGSSLAALVLLGFSPEAVFAITSFSQVLGFVGHANADFRVGRLNWVIGTPEQHRLHHSKALEEAGNYSALPLMDIAFGTFTWRPGRVPAEVGIVDRDQFPDPDSITRSLAHPVKAWLRLDR